MQLSYLNEPAVLYNLEYRYNEDMIYVRKLCCYNLSVVMLSIFPGLFSKMIAFLNFSFMVLDKSRACSGGCEPFQGGSVVRKS